MSSESTSRTIIRGTGIVGALTLLSRLLGFVRDMLVARVFGAGFFADAFFVAFRIPNLLRSFVAEGALTSAFVPVFAAELRSGHAGAQAALSAVTSLLLIVTSILSVAGMVFAREIVFLFAPGFSAAPDKLELCVRLTQIMFPFVLCVSLVAMVNGALNSVKIFGAGAWAQVWMNLALIIGAAAADFFVGREAAMVLAFSVIIGGVVQVLTQLPALSRAGFTLRPARSAWTPATRQIVALMIPATIGATVYQLSIFLNTILASLLEEGSVSWLFYADRLTQLPIGIFTVSLASVVLPTLSSAHVEGDSKNFSQSLMNSLRYTSFVIIPTSVGIFLLAEPLIKLMFERGAFSAISSTNTALAVRALAVGLWGVSCHSMVSRAFMAQKDTRTPTAIGALTLVVSFVLALVFMGKPAALPEGAFFRPIAALLGAIDELGISLSLRHAGLGLASSAASTIGFFALAVILTRRLGGVEWRPFLAATAKSVAASGVMAGAILGAGCTALPPLPAVITGAALGIGVFTAAARLLNTAELHETIGTIRRVVSRRGSGGAPQK